ncbi:Two-component response regulator ARR16 [Zea mays]|uniref:Two-component response regulator ARR16 n=1 Tax=Zea mays TaxID=4577 RepID=A0A1D6E9X6_MAIZE|nr:Two-component response regulator ARR16 [Zea mays]
MVVGWQLLALPVVRLIRKEQAAQKASNGARAPLGTDDRRLLMHQALFQRLQ